MVRGHPRRRRRAVLAGLAAIAAVSLISVANLWGLGSTAPRELGGVGVDPVTANSTTVPKDSFVTYLGNNHRTDSLSTSTPIVLSSVGVPTALWNFTAGGSIYSEPIVWKQVAYFGATDGYEYAVSTVTGSLVWKTFIGLDTVDTNCSSRPVGVTSTGAVAGARLIVSGGTSRVYALNLQTGRIMWNVSAGGAPSAGFYLWASPLILNGSAYIGIASRCDKPLVPAGLERLSLTGGKELAYFNSSTPNPNGSSIWASPSLSTNGSTVFVTTGNPYRDLASEYGESIIALNASTLSVQHVWQVPSSEVVGDGDFGATPTVYTLPNGTGAVAAENKNGYLYAWSASHLSLLWSTQLSDSDDDHFSAASASGKLFAIGETTEFDGVNYTSSLSSVNDRSGAVVWRDYFNQSVKATYDAPLYVDGLLVVPMGTTVYFVQASSGRVLSSVTPGGALVAPVSIASGVLFVGSGAQLVAYPVPGLASAGARPSSEVTSGTRSVLLSSFGTGLFAPLATISARAALKLDG